MGVFSWLHTILWTGHIHDLSTVSPSQDTFSLFIVFFVSGFVHTNRNASQLASQLGLVRNWTCDNSIGQYSVNARFSVQCQFTHPVCTTVSSSSVWITGDNPKGPRGLIDNQIHYVFQTRYTDSTDSSPFKLAEMPILHLSFCVLSLAGHCQLYPPVVSRAICETRQQLKTHFGCLALCWIGKPTFMVLLSGGR